MMCGFCGQDTVEVAPGERYIYREWKHIARDGSLVSACPALGPSPAEPLLPPLLDRLLDAGEGR